MSLFNGLESCGHGGVSGTRLVEDIRQDVPPGGPCGQLSAL